MKKKTLIIVESPTKIKTLKKILRGNFIFASSIGHIRDLPKKGFGIDIEHDFEPDYQILPDKKEVISELKKSAKAADVVYLAPDPDREGEAIAWHIAQILPKKTPIQRITFHSITKDAILEALQHPREIDQSLVNAQQARRLLDRIVGYKISPLLQRRVHKGRDGIVSAGRVQSVALLLVVEREQAINAFIPVEYWNVYADLIAKDVGFTATVVNIHGKKLEKENKENHKEIITLPRESDAQAIAEQLQDATFVVAKIERREKKRHPVPPFITSTLQQEASRHFGFSPARTMSIAQSLYEGIELGNGEAEGLITYMRTDSVRTDPEAIQQARAYIIGQFSRDYLPEKPKQYLTKKISQDAHEAIRPTNIFRLPEDIRAYLDPNQYKLYFLIWRRFIASQMNPIIYDTVMCEITTDKDITLRANGSIIKFSGFLALYEEKIDKIEEKESEHLLPQLEVGQILNKKKIHTVQSFTKPPARFTEASLVKELEKSGIGRPSTYATIMNKIISRAYTTKEKGHLKPTELGVVIIQMLKDNFRLIMDIDFTANMENDLDEIAENHKDWKEFLHEFWKQFLPLVQSAEENAHVPKIDTDIMCPKCGEHLQKIWSKNRYFYGCSRYPDCDFTTSLEALSFKKSDYSESFNWEQKCPQCGNDMIIRHGRFGPFLGCTTYPDCKGIVNIPKPGENLPEEMPKCPAIGCDGMIQPRRSRFGKIFFSCSNYPDCDVIVNDLKQLAIKYVNYHKHAYVKSVRKGRKEGGFSSLWKVSPSLEAIVDAKELSRGDVTKKIWEYIKLHNLQDPNNRRKILPDDKLSKVFGGSNAVDMMEIAKFLKNHLSRQ